MQIHSKQNLCSEIFNRPLAMLREIAKMQMGQGLDYDSKIMDKAREIARERFKNAQRRKDEAESELKKLNAKLMHESIERLMKKDEKLEEVLQDIKNNKHKNLLESRISELDKESQKLTREDFEKVLSEFNHKGLTLTNRPKLSLTSKGARLLGKGFLNLILQKLSKRGIGPHRAEDLGHGPWLASTIRPYETNDPYERISLEKSLLASLERRGSLTDLRLEDFRTYEAIHSTEVQFGILVDQSASMSRGGKMEAAVQTALALHELISSQFPEDNLKILAFSENVREVKPWELLNLAVPSGYTDIRTALQKFRQITTNEAGNKQASIITDSAPNFEDGQYVGFEKGLEGVLQEARQYRAAGIVLNIVMLDDDPKLKDVATLIAKQNLGRVFFTHPSDLGETLVDDYLSIKRSLLRF